MKKNIRAPQFLDRLYRDMRDRRLLLPALGLIVAVIAVPFLLKDQSSGTTAAMSGSSEADASASAMEPAVVTQELGVTQYKKRLNELNSKNPFHQQYTEPTEGQTLHATGTADSGSSTTSPTGTVDTGSSTSDTSSSVTPPLTGGTSSTPSSPSISTPSSPPQTSHVPKPGFHLYTYRASVKVGEPNKLQERPEVKRLAMLPTKGKPVVTFLGSTEDGDHAVFLVSPDVDSVKGDGRCAPNHSACQYLLMEPGDKANFHYVPNGKRYNLVLVDIHAVEIDDKPPKKVTGDASPQAKLPELGPG